MSRWFAQILESLSGQDPSLVYLFLFFNAFFESIFPPYPSDGIVLVFSFVAGRGAYSPFLTYLFTVLGSFGGVMAIYFIGMHKGRGLVLLTRIFSERHIQETEKIFERYGNPILFLNRFLPGLRAPICFVAGITRVPLLRMAVFSFVSIAVWNAILVPIGFTVGSNWERATDFLRNYNIVAWLAILVPVLIVIALYVLRKFVIAKQ